MPPRRKNQRNQGNNGFNDAPNSEKKRWRRRDNNPSANNIDMGMGNFYYPTGSNPMPFPSSGHPGGHQDNAFTPPGHASPYQPFYNHEGPVWASNRPYALEQAEAQVLDLVAAREDEVKDQEKRLFLEEYRYVGQQTQYEPPHIDDGVVEATTEAGAELGMEIGAVNTNIGNGGDSVDNLVAEEVAEIAHDDNTGSQGTVFKLRGDAPEFIPMNKKTSGRQRQDSVTIVTSWY